MTNLPEVVSRDEWLAARRSLLVQEKQHTSDRDRLNAERRRLPMVRVDEDYRFEGPEGTVGLADLFDGRRQLVVHHFMWDFEVDADGVEHPRETGCPSCSACADGIGKLRQLHIRNTTLVAVTRAPYPTLEAYRERMGWSFPWYSSWGSAFNYDMSATLDERVAPVLRNFRTEAELAAEGVPWGPGWRGDWPGISTFLRDGDDVFHTYSTFGRGFELFQSGYAYLDLTPLGRQEEWEEPHGRATPLGMQTGGPVSKLPDEYPDCCGRGHRTGVCSDDR